MRWYRAAGRAACAGLSMIVRAVQQASLYFMLTQQASAEGGMQVQGRREGCRCS